MQRVDKPWGHEEIWAYTDKYVGKVLFINAGHSLSRQYHEVKEETLRIEEGVMSLELGEGDDIEVKTLVAGDIFHISPGVIHRMTALENVRVYEVSTPELDDVVRLQDDYGR